MLKALRARLALLFLLLKFRARMLRYSLTAAPMLGAQDGDDDEAAADDKDTSDGSDDAAADEDEEDGATDEGDDAATTAKSTEPDWKRMARKHEREAKKLRKQFEDSQQRLKDRDDADKTEQEKKVDEAYDRAKTELQEAHDKERRQDRLEAATARVAGKGLTIGEGDKAKTVRFADPDDAQLHLERAIRDGELDPEDIFDAAGKVRTEALEEALTELLARKPHLAVDGKATKVAGTADARKGTPAKTDLTVEDELKKIRRHKDGTPTQQVLVGRRAG